MATGVSVTWRPNVAAIQTRSRITVSVKNRPADIHHFPCNALDRVEACVDEVHRQGLGPLAGQADDTWEARLRQKCCAGVALGR